MLMRELPVHAVIYRVNTFSELDVGYPDGTLVFVQDVETIYFYETSTTSWQPVTGSVVGVTATHPIADNRLVRGDGGLRGIQGSGITVDDANNISGVATITADEFRVDAYTYINSTDVQIGDNIIVLNADETGTPTQDAGIEIERGTSTSSQLLWDETGDYWTAGLTGSLSRVIVESVLSSTSTGEGASLVGLEDSAGYFTSSDVEGALAELGSGSVATEEAAGLVNEFTTDPGAVVVGDLVYPDSAIDNKVLKATDNNSPSAVIGSVKEVVNSTTAKVITVGTLTGYSGLVRGKSVWVSTSGQPTTTVPVTNYRQRIGSAFSSSKVFLMVNTDRVKLT